MGRPHRKNRGESRQLRADLIAKTTNGSSERPWGCRQPPAELIGSAAGIPANGPYFSVLTPDQRLPHHHGMDRRRASETSITALRTMQEGTTT